MDAVIPIDLVVKQLREGSETAFTTIFDQYHRLLYALAYRYLKSGEEAEDAVQYTLMRLWEQRETLNEQSGIRSLLFTILKNHILNELRHRKVVFEKHYEMLQEQDEGEEDFFDSLADKDFNKQLYEIINRLPPQRRQVCLLKIEQGLSNQEVADKMNLSLATVKSHYTQAVKTLRSEIGRLLILIEIMISCL